MEKVSKEIREKGLLLVKLGKVKKEIEAEKRIYFKVFGETETHSVIFDKEKKEWKCDCPYFTLHQKICSHIFAANLKESS